MVTNSTAATYTGALYFLVDRDANNKPYCVEPGNVFYIAADKSSDIKLDKDSKTELLLYQEGRSWYAMVKEGSIKVAGVELQSLKLEPNTIFLIDNLVFTIVTHQSYDKIKSQLKPKKLGKKNQEVAQKKSNPVGADTKKRVRYLLVALCALIAINIVVYKLKPTSQPTGNATSQRDEGNGVNELTDSQLNSSLEGAEADPQDQTASSELVSPQNQISLSDNKLEIANLHSRAVRQYDNGNIEGALSILDRLMKIDPDNDYYEKIYIEWTTNLNQTVDEYFTAACDNVRYLRDYEARNYFALVVSTIRDHDNSKYNIALENLDRYDKGEPLKRCEGFF